MTSVEKLKKKNKKLKSVFLLTKCCCCCIVVKSCPMFLQPHGLLSIRFLYAWDFTGKHTGVGCHFLLQAIFPTQGLNPHLWCLLHCRWILYHWATRGAPQKCLALKHIFHLNIFLIFIYAINLILLHRSLKFHVFHWD